MLPLAQSSCQPSPEDDSCWIILARALIQAADPVSDQLCTGWLQMQSCSINRHMMDEVGEREKVAEATMQRRRKALEDAHMDDEIRRLTAQRDELIAKGSALRKVRVGGNVLPLSTWEGA